MSGVVLRCPNCGTTKATPGECEACHEAQVRFFCTNHAPGRWLEDRQCPDCGARFGETARAPAPPRAAAPPPRAPETRPSPAAPPVTPGRARAAPWSRRRPASTEEGLAPRDEREALRDAIRARFPDLLRTASRGRRAPPGTMEDRGDGTLPAGPAAAGCLRAALFLVMFLIFAFLALSALIGGSLMQFFGFYY